MKNILLIDTITQDELNTGQNDLLYLFRYFSALPAEVFFEDTHLHESFGPIRQRLTNKSLRQYPLEFTVKKIDEIHEGEISDYHGIILRGRPNNASKMTLQEVESYYQPLYNEIVAKNTLSLAICGGHQRLCAAGLDYENFDNILIQNRASGKPGFYPINLSESAKQLDLFDEIDFLDINGNTIVGALDHNYSLSEPQLSDLLVGGYYQDVVEFVYGPAANPHIFSFQFHPEYVNSEKVFENIQTLCFDEELMDYVATNYQDLLRSNHEFIESRPYEVSISSENSVINRKILAAIIAENHSEKIFKGFLRKVGEYSVNQ